MPKLMEMPCIAKLVVHSNPQQYVSAYTTLPILVMQTKKIRRF